jgi:hypothetical protein
VLIGTGERAKTRNIPADDDPVSNVLKWILLAVAIVCFALISWATVITYDRWGIPRLEFENAKPVPSGRNGSLNY